MILSSYVLMPLDVTQGNQANVVIKIALLDYSDRESRQWGFGVGSQRCQLRSEEGGVGGYRKSCC